MQRSDESGASPSPRAHPALEGVGAFLAAMLGKGYELGLLDHETFFKCIPARRLMLDLPGTVRGSILQKVRFDDMPICFDLSAEACGEMLEFLMEQRKITPENVLKILTPERCARYLNHKQLWSIVTALPFWHGIRKGVDPQVLKTEFEYLTILLSSALKHGLVTETDVVDGIGIGTLRGLLLSWQQDDLIKRMREHGGKAEQSMDSMILQRITIKAIVRRIPKVLWEKVVNPKIEVAYDLWSMRPPESTPPGPDERPGTTYSIIYGNRS